MRPLLPSGLLLAAGLTLPLMATSTGCLACNEPGCGGGFSLHLEAADPQGFAPGAYRFEITGEDSVFEIKCVFTETNETSVCGQALRTEGKLRSFPRITFGGLTFPDRDDPVGRVYISVVDTSETDGSFKAYRGPEYVKVRVERDGAEMSTLEYMPEYDRIRHRGDPECGYCDEAEEVVELL